MCVGRGVIQCVCRAGNVCVGRGSIQIHLIN